MSEAAGQSRPRATPREAATRVVRALTEAGHVAYFAGGCVRDRLLGIEPKDYDVATDARPDAICAIFPRAQSVGEAFGVLLVRAAGHIVEVATFRTDGVYRDGRHPDAVEFSDAEHDASRRDFTINGLFEDPETGGIIDHVGGQADLAAHEVNAIGDARARLREDRLRMLRAIRFAARFGFAIGAETAEAIREGAGDLRGVSRERIGQEVRWMLTDPNRAVAAWEMQYLGVDGPVLEEPSVVDAPRRLGQLPDEVAFGTALAAWALDRHAMSGRDLESVVEGWTKALVLSNAEARELARALAVHRALRTTWGELGVAGQKRLAASDAFDAGLLLLRADDRQAFVDVRRRVLELDADGGLAPTPLITGGDLVATGLEPGPVFRRVLDAPSPSRRP
jgi:tRNA nucleotidyltransferase/poly(A) polymerase